MFEKLKEKIISFGLDSSRLPELNMFFDFVDFEQFLRSQAEAWASLRVAIVRDGVSKNFLNQSGEQLGDFESVLSKLLQKIQLEADRHGPAFGFLDLVLSAENGFADSKNLAQLSCAKRLSAWLEQEQIDLLIAVGSGSLTDVAKHAACVAKRNTTLWSMPTALTVTAFTSAFAVLEENGYKRTYSSLLPAKTLFLNFLTRCAPFELRQAGVGDLLAGFTSYADWYLSSALGFSNDFVPEVAHFMVSCQKALQEPQAAAEPLSDSGYNNETVALLSDLLAAAGLAMNLGKSSAPQSGGEHATSHALDWLRNVAGRPRWPHGTQVALTGLSACAMFDWLRGIDFVPIAWLAPFSEEELSRIVTELVENAPYLVDAGFLGDFKQRAEWLAAHRSTLDLEMVQALEVSKHKAAQWAALRERFAEIQNNWQGIRAVLAQLTLSMDEYARCLQAWGIPEVVEKMHPPGRLVELRWALRFSVFYRNRFGVQDFAFWVGEDPTNAAAL